MSDSESPTRVSGLIDLAAAALGGRTVSCSDDFFASASQLIQPGRGRFVPGKYTDRGKWMDGWESRRRRGPGHDWCILELGARGQVRLVDIDTNHFHGNHPAFASLDGLTAPRGAPAERLERADWTELVPQTPLKPGAQNLCVPRVVATVTHLRLNVFPDGGVARLRAHGEVVPDFTERDADDETSAHLEADWVDLAALHSGALPLACSDAFFSPMEQLLMPGRAPDMGSGWETRRRRGPGHDWMIVRLGARGTPRLVEVDTSHFKGNYPDRCSLQGLDAPDEVTIGSLIASSDWAPLLDETPLSADARHFFAVEPSRPASHVRLCIYPDGGVARLRVWGPRDA